MNKQKEGSLLCDIKDLIDETNEELQIIRNKEIRSNLEIEKVEGS